MSFSQEVKDFLGGYSAVSGIKNDRENLQLQKDRLALDKEGQTADIAYKNAMLALQQQQLQRQASGGSGGSRPSGGSAGAIPDSMTGMVTNGTTPGTPRMTVPQAAAAAKQYNADANAAIGMSPTEEIPVDTPDETDLEDLGAYADGGVVTKPEEAGVLPAEAPLYGPRVGVTPPGNAQPAQQPAPAAQPEADPEATKIVMAKSKEAMTAALPYILYDSSKPAVGDDGQTGMSLAELAAVTDAVDPNKVMPDHIRAGVALSGYYNHFMEQGQTDRAAKAAYGFLQANKQATQTLGTLAWRAMEAGDINNACRLLNDACNRFPTGHRIQVTPSDKYGVTYEVLDETGKPIEEGHASAQQLWGVIAGVQDGSLYTQQMVDFVRQNQPEKKPEAGGSARNPRMEVSEDGMSGGMKPLSQSGGAGRDPNTVVNPGGTSGGRPVIDPTTGEVVPKEDASSPGVLESLMGGVSNVLSGASGVPQRTDGLKPMDDKTLADVRKLLASGVDKNQVIGILKRNGFSPEGL